MLKNELILKNPLRRMGYESDDILNNGEFGAVMAEIDRRLEAAIVELLTERDWSICPSDAARRVDPEGWRELLERTRRAGRRRNRLPV